MAIKLQWTMQNSDMNVVGETLGYDWNAVCDEARRLELYGQDGEGSFSISTPLTTIFKDSKMMLEIFTKIFNDHPGMKTIEVVNN